MLDVAPSAWPIVACSRRRSAPAGLLGVVRSLLGSRALPTSGGQADARELLLGRGDRWDPDPLTTRDESDDAASQHGAHPRSLWRGGSVVARLSSEPNNL